MPAQGHSRSRASPSPARAGSGRSTIVGRPVRRRITAFKRAAPSPVRGRRRVGAVSRSRRAWILPLEGSNPDPEEGPHCGCDSLRCGRAFCRISSPLHLGEGHTRRTGSVRSACCRLELWTECRQVRGAVWTPSPCTETSMLSSSVLQLTDVSGPRVGLDQRFEGFAGVIDFRGTALTRDSSSRKVSTSTGDVRTAAPVSGGTWMVTTLRR